MVRATIIRVLNSENLASLRGMKKDSCNIIVAEGLFAKNKIGRFVVELLNRTPTSCVIITDSTVKKLYGSILVQELSRIARTDLITLPPGERSKGFSQCTKILSDLAKLGLDREGALILLGGGVVGDIGGFAASIYKRGVKHVQIPTTLLAQIDSSIGGKTGVDTEWGKNQIGTIYQPAGVLIDPAFLKTLPRHEILNGIGEMIKYGVTSSAKIFSELEANDIESGSDITHLIEPCCKIKARIVSKDPNDFGIRSTLNYGHTIGHSLEAASNYTMSHGISVLVGMISEGWLAHELGLFQTTDFLRQEALIKRLLRKDSLLNLRMSQNRITKFALTDKKNASGKLRMSLPERIGRMHVTKDGSFKTPVPIDLLKPSIDYAKNVLSVA
jgi:3-dehydroquinate synthase